MADNGYSETKTKTQIKGELWHSVVDAAIALAPALQRGSADAENELLRVIYEFVYRDRRRGSQKPKLRAVAGGAT